MNDMCFIPFHCASRKETLSLELRIIHQLQAPIQNRQKQNNNRPPRFREWPRHRKQLSFIRENELNLANTSWSRESLRFPDIPDDVIDFATLCALLKK